MLTLNTTLVNIITQRSASDKPNSPIKISELSPRVRTSTNPITVKHRSENKVEGEVGVEGAAPALKLMGHISCGQEHEAVECVEFRGTKSASSKVQWTWDANDVFPRGVSEEKECWIRIPAAKRGGVTAGIVVRCVIDGWLLRKPNLNIPQKPANDVQKHLHFANSKSTTTT